ncbi:MAG: hypothetical protein SFT93_05520 [Rickettsiaceae bacterium]|nr:hypothetical protein [Rickettsiaceae bacterium]
MSKAKTASKNNPTARQQAKEFMFEGKKIKPVKLVLAKTTYLAAEYDGSGDLVLDNMGQPMSWQKASRGN